jgi:hypothetical protein
VTISIHLANTVSGDYDVRLPLPKPLHCDAVTGRIVRGENDIRQVVGFTSDPDEFDVDLTWQEWAESDPLTPDDIWGLFPVVIDTPGDIATLTVPVTGVSVDGRRYDRAGA